LASLANVPKEVKHLRTNPGPAKKMLLLDGEVVRVAGIENGREAWRDWIPFLRLQDGQAHPDDDLRRLETHALLADKSECLRHRDRQAVEDLHALSRRSVAAAARPLPPRSVRKDRSSQRRIRLRSVPA